MAVSVPKGDLGVFLGKKLAKARREAGFRSQEALSQKLGWDHTVIAKAESGERPASDDVAESLAGLFPGLCNGMFVELCEIARVTQRNLNYPESFRSFVPYEEAATVLRWHEHSMIPGLLQTPQYARAVLSTRPDATPEWIEEQVASRLARQRIFSKDYPPRLYALLDESILYRAVAPPDVMRDQLNYLADMSEQPNITVQIVPLSAGAHSGLLGAFVLAETDDSPPVVYLEHAGLGETVSEPSVVARVMLTFEALRADALPQGPSRDLIRKAAEGTWQTS